MPKTKKTKKVATAAPKRVAAAPKAVCPFARCGGRELEAANGMLRCTHCGHCQHVPSGG